MKPASLASCVVVLGLAVHAHAADIVGSWEGTLALPDAQSAATFAFARTGAGQLSGMVKTAEWGDFPMLDLKLEGKALTFRSDIEGGAYHTRGLVKDDQIHLKVTAPDGSEFALVLRRPATVIDGRWVAKVEGPDGGAMELAFIFRVDGAKLTGVVAGPWGESAFVEAHVEGKAVSFTTQFDGTRIVHSGTFDSDTMFLHVRAQEWEFPMTLRREKPAAQP